jgi:hypothetical protein
MVTLVGIVGTIQQYRFPASCQNLGSNILYLLTRWSVQVMLFPLAGDIEIVTPADIPLITVI